MERARERNCFHVIPFCFSISQSTRTPRKKKGKAANLAPMIMSKMCKIKLIKI